MKKIIINILFVITFLILYFLQLNFFSWFRIAGVMPNLFVILIFYIGLFAGRSVGVTYGILFGLVLDLLVGENVGITAIMLGIVGVIGGFFDKNFSKDSRITILIMVIGCTTIYEIGMYVLRYAILKSSIEILSFSKILIAEIVFNVILTIIFYPLIQKTGHKVENEYKGSKILTRYF